MSSGTEKMHQYTVVMPEVAEPPCDYPKGVHSLLMLLQLVLGAITIGLVADMGSYQAQAVLSENEFTVAAFISFGESTALMMIAYGCLITTFLLLVSSILSSRSFHHVPKSLFFVLYHLISASLYLSSGLSVVILGYQRRYEKYYITAGALGIVNSILYIFSTCLGLRALSLK
ncbi:MARVEL domain-containing protein [Trichonephila inaurata madagascariensis]|uniref:MARVEL domain-containing protein n=4 Tax=Nephilidae TaxID=450948 RepID=A0A8X7CRQ8_9ARAC|nr:MARVEL domain-containing protein [Trichonephila inaurata madagascariensis]